MRHNARQAKSEGLLSRAQGFYNDAEDYRAKRDAVRDQKNKTMTAKEIQYQKERYPEYQRRKESGSDTDANDGTASENSDSVSSTTSDSNTISPSKDPMGQARN